MTNIREHLDKRVTTIEWLDYFLNVMVRHLSYCHLDHFPLLISSSPTSTKKSYSFKFETWWTLEPKFEDFIKDIWNISEGNVLLKMENLRDGI